MKKIRQIKELFEAGKEKQAKDMLGHLLNDSTKSMLCMHKMDIPHDVW